ncbi:MAG: hypothetical protein IJ828_03165, partial [Treponema sp.]|nr:hypothetical protein [Treponema sp.]
MIVFNKVLSLDIDEMLDRDRRKGQRHHRNLRHALAQAYGFERRRGRREYAYNAYQLLEETSPNLRRMDQRIAYSYDGLNRFVKVDYPKTVDTVYAYGASGGCKQCCGKGHAGDRAIKFFNKAIELYPEAAATLELRAEAKENLGSLKETLSDYEKVVKLKPKCSKAYFNQGLIFEYKHDYKKAVYFDSKNQIYLRKLVDFKKY